MKKKQFIIFEIMGKRTIVTCLIFALLNLWGFSMPTTFKQLTDLQGLSQNSVYHVAFSPSGEAWISTAEGLNRYNGYRFEVFGKGSGGSKKLRSVGFFKTFCISDSEILTVGDEGIEFIDLGKKSSKLLFRFHAHANEICILPEKKSNKILILLGNHILEFDASKRVLTQLRNDLLNQSKELQLSAIQLTNQTNFLISCGNNFLFSKTTNQLTPLSNLPFSCSNLCLINPNQLVYCTWENGKTTLLSVDLSTLKVNQKSATLLSEYEPHARFIEFSQEKLWISDHKLGIARFSNQLTYEGNIPTFRIIGKQEPNLITLNFTIHNNCFWFCSDPNGISIGDHSPTLFSNYFLPLEHKKLITKGIFTDSKGIVYAANLGGGLQLFSKDGADLGSIEQFGTRPSEKLFFQAFNTILPLGNDRFFIHSFSFTGIFDAASKSFRQFTQVKLPSFERNFYQAAIKNEEVIWISIGKQLFELNIKTGKQILLTEAKEPITFIEKVTDGFLLGSEQGLYLSRKQAFQKLTAVPSVMIKQILRDRKNQFWISTIEGVFVLSSDFKLIKVVNTSNGLINSFVYGGNFQNDIFWGSSNRGLFSISPDFNVKTYGMQDGVIGNEFNSNAWFKDENSNLFFGGVAGITCVNANNHPLKTTFPLRLDYVTINDSLISLNQPIRASWNCRRISFYFAGIHPNNPELIQYKYRLKGVEKSWTSNGNSREINFNYPSVGSFILEVEANLKGSNVTQRIEVPFEVDQVPWKSGKAIAIYVLLLTAIVVLIIRYSWKKRERILKAEIASQLKIQKERERISRDLHDHAGSLVTYLMMDIEHFEQSDVGHEKVENMRQTARNLMNTLRETIWALSDKPISAEEFSDKLITYCRKYIPLKVTYTSDLQQPLEIRKEAVLHMYRICQEALHNAVKHSASTHLELKISTHNNALTIQISDFGKGFDRASTDKKRFGLSNMENRAKEAGVAFNLEAEIGKGTTITLTYVE